jgi:tetratricopeptide (TPR) repeat protein
MASIFLSYAREDLVKAERLAALLAEAGHSTWWDRHLHAGARFTAEIDEALASADHIVVLWSRHSVESAWVQDEAAVGRDTGRLIPVLLDDVTPPLGFRQYQSVDMSAWSGRGKPRKLSDLIKALDATTLREASARQGPSPKPGRQSIRWWVLSVALATILLLGGALIWRLQRKSEGPSLLIAAANAAGDPASRSFAHQVALDLSRFQSVYLGSLAVREGTAKSADYQAEVGLERDGAKTSADISLNLKRRAGVTWANKIEGRSDHLVDLRQQAAAVLSTVIRCAIEADASQAKLKDADFRLFLDGCTAISSDFSQANAADLMPIFEKITRSNPKFAPAHAMLALAAANSFASTPAVERPALLKEARAALAQATALDPNSEDVFAVDAIMHSSNPSQWNHAFPIIDRGLSLHPNSPVLLRLRSERLTTIGRMKEAASSARQASEFDPLSPQVRVSFVDALAYSGQLNSAYDELAKSEAIWPNSSILENARYRLDLRYGDPRNALQLLKRGETGDATDVASGPSWEDFLRARIDPTPRNVEAAPESFRARYRRDPADIPGYLQALGTFGRTDEAFNVTRNPITLDSMEASTDTLFRPHMRSLMSDPRFIDLAHRLGLLAYWRQSGVWPDFCRDPRLPYDCRKEAAKYPN